MSEYKDIKTRDPIVYVIQELPGTSIGRPKFNIMGALKYGKLKVLLKENTQIILSPGPVIFELRRLLKNYTSNFLDKIFSTNSIIITTLTASFRSLTSNLLLNKS